MEHLESLCERLVDCGVLPYYLHQLDKVTGASHFEVDKERGLAMIVELANRLPGYAVPKYVAEITGQASKTAIQSGKTRDGGEIVQSIQN